MFPCSSSHNPFTYTSSGQEEQPPLSYSHLQAPFFVDDDLFLSHLLSQQQLFVATTSSQAQTESSVEASNSKEIDNKNLEAASPKKKSNGRSNSKPTNPRKRSGKKDRHSKICTAQGPRDRRMRLSLQIARKFFDLQDMLGFDKASKTIEWLFTKSKTAIKELTESISQVKQSCSHVAKSSTVSFTSESEVGSVNVEVADDGEFVNLAREKKNRKLHRVARDSRDKARARARERTREKLMIRGFENSKQSSEAKNSSNLGQLWSSSAPLETGEEAGFCNQEMKSSLKMMADQGEETSNNDHLQQYQTNSVSINEKILGIEGTPKCSLIFNSSHNVAVSSGVNSEEDFPGFPVNWDSNNSNIQSFCCTTSMKPSTGDVQVKLPSAIATATYNSQEQMLSSIFMTTTPNTQEQSPSSYFITYP
jgi:hypothetical protein